MKENVFETIKKLDENGSEYWSSRDLSKVLEYTDYRKFLNVIDKAKMACENSGEVIHSHFVHKDEMVQIGSRERGQSRLLAEIGTGTTNNNFSSLIRANRRINVP